MATIQCRVEQNPLTTPESYKLRFIPRSTGGYDDVAARLAVKNPVWTAELIKAILQGSLEEIKEMLIEGMQVTLENACTFRPALHANLSAPDEPLPPIDELLDINISASRPYVKDVRQEARIEVLPPEEKVPVIISAADTSLELNDVVNSAGVLRLSGSNLAFDKNKPDCGCFIEGTAGGRTVQTQLASVSDTEILLVPHLPAQAHPWNNEFIVSINTKYTENGTLRTGTYGRRLRSPLVLSGFGANNPQDIGILTGDAAAPYVKATAAQMSASERLRIQAVLDSRSGQLMLSLLAMSEHGAAGNAVTVAANGNYTLPGFSGSAVSSLSVKVENYTELVALLRSGYRGRMVDVLDMGM
ncbi:hypothetical protein [Candidatus Electronema sp. JC]|uniref:hypothetical protein n=1 Tax=Candidatus Electronema sp. JC TaxID=3401570 RepID=UPI003B42F592